MKLFLYEHITGGGLLSPGGPQPLPASLLREGRAMTEAVAADLAQLADVETTLLCDHRVELAAPGCRVVRVESADAARAAFDRLAAQSDATFLIAPETGGALADCCRRVEQCGGRLVGPDLPLVELASDKHATAVHLAKAGIPVPQGIALAPGELLPASFPYPAVVKPCGGCGSQEVRLVSSAVDAAALGPLPFAARLERYCKGQAASVAVLCAPGEQRPLPPFRQHLSDDGRFTYLGGSLMLEPKRVTRATRLAAAAVAALPDPRGYVGVDLVLGATESDDFVIEINPRLTTSYVGLRAAAQGSLAAAMLAISAGEPAELSFRAEPLQFDASGTVRHPQGIAS